MKLPVMALAVVASGMAVPAEAQVRAWFACQTGGKVLVVPGSIVGDFRAGGLQCSFLDLDRASSYGKACANKAMIPGYDYQVYSEADDSFSPLDCAVPSGVDVAGGTVAAVTKEIWLAYMCGVVPGRGRMQARHLGGDDFEVTFAGNGGQFYEGKGTATDTAFQWTQKWGGKDWIWRFNIVGGSLVPIEIDAPVGREDCSLEAYE